MSDTERSIRMRPETMSPEDRSDYLRHALDDLSWAAAAFTGAERTRAILAMTVLADLLGEGQTMDDIKQWVDSNVNLIAEDWGPSAITVSRTSVEPASEPSTATSV